jgi:hypothetical protein
MLLSLSKEVSCMRASFATNLEGVYSGTEPMFITNDHGEGEKIVGKNLGKQL